MTAETLEPTWVTDLGSWWERLLGPVLSSIWSDVRKQVGEPKLLEKAHGATVRMFENELAQYREDLAVFEAEVGPSDWAPFASQSRQVYERIHGRWSDPQATQPLTALHGPLNPLDLAKGVVRGINVAVTAIGVAWALASVAEVRRGRKFLHVWLDHLRNGVEPSKRDFRRANVASIQGDCGCGCGGGGDCEAPVVLAGRARGHWRRAVAARPARRPPPPPSPHPIRGFAGEDAQSVYVYG